MAARLGKHIWVAAAAALALAGFAAANVVGAAVIRPAPIVVELFQSQGCSSCPPANAIANTLAARADLLVLSYGVTYWDQLGWRDTFASAENTQRQYHYARGLHRDNVATPQMIINGRIDLVGNNRASVDRALQSAQRPIALDARIDGVVVPVGAAPQGGADVWLVRYDPRERDVAVHAGENNGRTLPHRDVVRELRLLGRWNGSAARFAAPPAHEAGLKTAYLLQAPDGGPIIGAGVAP
ncbi:MAG TPA: DUF1223 domain-containing protein [Caulobacterales bacterium]|nr:DUF1223 domain-containing protein [Caulobacterales bacterium]